ncbi:extracellular solute-binding protein [Pseudothauera nasutitermitis]|uniref:sn-glycerol-3-phosphate-binding periplasmic protein UgpB n=1 Tax=Pseudothauera nasutitermitis TaxID=2565930 RepID=A0A4S4B2N1_9RHOO|nr:extracellular solute-binding protein [Pseudothauera nasutitermitis]THF65947.1 extracellular solute-binding protein [Pseudothauera nasutitermitis]
MSSPLRLQRLVRAGFLLAAAVALPALAQSQAARAPQELELVHSFDLARTQALQTLVDHFNAQNKEYHVVLGRRDWQQGDLPHLMILDGEAEELFLAGQKPRYRPLHELMRSAGVPLQTVRPPVMMTRKPVDAQGRLLALPVGLATPVLYVNRESFRKAGLNPDMPIQTWQDLQHALGQLFDSGNACPYTVSEPGKVMVENLSAWHNTPVTARRGRADAPAFNGMVQIKHVAMMASWHRARYLHIFDRGPEAERRFASGECAVLAGPSASWANFRRQSGLDIGVLRLPYYDDFPGAPQNTLADGASLWVAAGKKPAEYRVLARFVAFWLQPENQVAWQREAGYLPLNRAGLLASESELLGEDLENVRVAVHQLTNKPATADSSSSSLVGRESVRRVLDEELAAVWADVKPAKEALDTAVARLHPPAGAR